MEFDTIRFSQTSLQDFVDCPRRFQLRHLENQPWPAVQSQPVLDRERHLDLGVRFHRLVERHQLGIAPDVLREMIDNPLLEAWWSAYLAFDFLHRMEGTRFPEYVLSVNFNGRRIVAVFDLLVFQPGGTVVIFDWKTYTQSPTEGWFLSQLQSSLYPVALVLASREGRWQGVVEPEQVKMVYWMASVPEEPVVLPYSSVRFERDWEQLKLLLGDIELSFVENDWPQTGDTELCRYCEYRSLCGVDVSVGVFSAVSNNSANDAVGSYFLLGDVFASGF